MFFFEIFFVQFVFAQYEVENPEESVRLISPYGAVARSAIIPGWGQIHAQNYVSGSFSFLGTTGLLVGGLVSHRSFRQIYDKEYALVAKVNSKSPAALSIYGRVNQVYKIRQFFLLTAVHEAMINSILALIGLL